VAVFHEVEEDHSQHDYERDKEYRAEYGMFQTALKKRSEPDHWWNANGSLC